MSDIPISGKNSAASRRSSSSSAGGHSGGEDASSSSSVVGEGGGGEDTSVGRSAGGGVSWASTAFRVENPTGPGFPCWQMIVIASLSASTVRGGGVSGRAEVRCPQSG